VFGKTIIDRRASLRFTQQTFNRWTGKLMLIWICIHKCDPQTSTHRLVSKRRFALFRRFIYASYVATMPFFRLSQASAQEAVFRSLAGEASAQSLHLQLESIPYNLKVSDLRLLATPSLTASWNDNINASQIHREEDFILTPLLQMTGSYPLTQYNLFSLNVGVGYDKYVEHNQHSALRLTSDTGFLFDVLVKDFHINFHDRISYVRDSTQNPALSGSTAGSADFGTVQNLVGLSLWWDLGDVILMTGYDHENIISGTQQFNSLNRSSELVIARAGFKWNPAITTGIETSGAFSQYDQMVFNDNDSYSAGLYADWQPSEYLRIEPRAGYAITKFQNTSRFLRTSDLNSFYVDLKITRRVTDAFNYSVDAGHEVSPGIQSDAVEYWFVRPNLSLNVIKNLSLSPFIDYEHGTQGEGNVAGNLSETYDYLGAGLSASYPLMKKFRLSLNYRLTLRASSLVNGGYSQNVVGLQFAYQP
jgi:hypothetical protein